MILITGCARSGTSLITKILQMHGVYLGQENRVNSLFENVAIRENLLKPYLTQCDADPLGQDRLPDTENLPSSDYDLRKEMGYYLPRVPRAYKDAKLTLVWPVFDQAWPSAKWILVRRDKDKIVESCMRTSFMSKRKTADAWGKWVDEHEKRFEEMKYELDLIEVWTDDVIADPKSFKPIADFCSIDFNAEVVQRSIEKKRWHAR